MEHDLQSKFGRTAFFKNAVFVFTGILAVVGGGMRFLIYIINGKIQEYPQKLMPSLNW
ncbi:hypothetical protein [Photobacterium sanguinicancri]|uniref:hypothetical protein n=1 Tax=Photobacterium sanguinicancri TaxID=875932 RepID=UPI000B33C8A9|nr:hypothetical protein [Photobacterium sanguinicancri]